MTAATADERALVAHALARGHVVLDDAHYAIGPRGEVLLPNRASRSSALRLLRAFEGAARAHAAALERRSALRLVP